MSLLLGSSTVAMADTDSLPPGYSLRVVSSGLASSAVSSIPQLAFKPGDLTHVYATRDADDKVSRYDYDPVTGELSSEVTVAQYTDSPRHVVGLAFHGTNLYTTSENNDSGRTERISRWFDADDNGVYEARHDIVHSIPANNHYADQLQVAGDSLYVGIGAGGRKGDPSEENIYTMTIARIVDLTQVVTTNVGPDFKGPVNYLASVNEWTNTAATDGQLRYYASGFRNPFGIAFDADGDLWVSVNGNSDAGFLSDDFLYRKVQPGDEGEFPPPEFGFTKYISGNPVTNFVNFGLSPSPGGFDFIREGPDEGKVVLGNLGATRDNTVGRDLWLIDPDTGSSEQIYQWTFPSEPGPSYPYVVSDVVRDPFGRFLISDYGHAKIWLLTPPLPQPALQASLSGNTIDLAWPLTAVEYALEETSDLSDTNSWTASAAATQITADGIQAGVPAGTAPRFFRLIKP